MDSTTERLAVEALDSIRANGGGTFEGRTLLPFTPEDGYAVGVGGFAMAEDIVNPAVIAFALKAVAGEYNTTFAGAWVDKGQFVFDAVLYRKSKVDAVLEGLRHGQEAIYDFANKDVIVLKGDLA